MLDAEVRPLGGPAIIESTPDRRLRDYRVELPLPPDVPLSLEPLPLPEEERGRNF